MLGFRAKEVACSLINLGTCPFGFRLSFLLVHLFRAQESQVALVAPRQSASKRERDETDDFLRPTNHPLACHVGTQAGTYAWIGSGVRGLRSTGRIRQGMLSLCIVGGCCIRQVPTRSALSRTRPTELRQLRLRGEIRVNETWFRHCPPRLTELVTV